MHFIVIDKNDSQRIWSIMDLPSISEADQDETPMCVAAVHLDLCIPDPEAVEVTAKGLIVFGYVLVTVEQTNLVVILDFLFPEPREKVLRALPN